MAGAKDRVSTTAASTLPLLEETASVSTHDVITGRVRVSTHVENVEQIVSAELQSDDVEVTRVPIGQPVVGSAPQVRIEGDLTIVPIFEEIVVVETRLVLKEELHIRKRTTIETVAQPITLRRQHAKIERASAPSK